MDTYRRYSSPSQGKNARNRAQKKGEGGEKKGEGTKIKGGGEKSGGVFIKVLIRNRKRGVEKKNQMASRKGKKKDAKKKRLGEGDYWPNKRGARTKLREGANREKEQLIKGARSVFT